MGGANPNEVFTFLPIRQLNRENYAPPAEFTRVASRAAAYTIVGRAIGTTREIPALRNVRISNFLDENGATVWRGAIVAQASRGPFTAIPAADSLGSANVVPALQAGRPVVLRGSYGAGAAKAVALAARDLLRRQLAGSSHRHRG